MTKMNAAERTSKQIEKEQLKLTGLITKRDELTSNYQAQLDKLNESIEEITKKIEVLRKRETSEKLSAVASLLNKRGISVDDLYKAATNKDFYGLQERLEHSPASQDSPSHAGAESATLHQESVETSVSADSPVLENTEETEETDYFDDLT